MALTILDAGVVIGGLEDHNVHHVSARAAIDAAVQRGDVLLLPTSAYAEVMVGPAHNGAAAMARIDTALDFADIAIVPADREIAHAAAQLRAKHRSLRLPDALVIGTAVILDADHLLTTDRAWKRLRSLGVRGLTVVG